jgi:pimeloyl-ACP methyl ester carboxylesterase
MLFEKSASNSMQAQDEALIDRGFVRLEEGLVHYRSRGSLRDASKPPLYLAHAGPGSSRGMVPFMKALGPDRFLIAPDMLGNGDSDPPASESVAIDYYADTVVRILDRLGIEQIDFYGSHTGALIGMDLAIRHKHRLRKLVLDGVLIFSDAEKKDLLANYAPKMIPDDHGGYLSWTWQFIRDMSLFFPHYRRDATTRLPNGTAPPDQIYGGVVDVLKALKTYHVAYNAAFAYNVEAALPKIDLPTLLTCFTWDPMHVYLDQSTAMVKGATSHLFQAAETQADKAAVITAFLDG